MNFNDTLYQKKSPNSNQQNSPWWFLMLTASVYFHKRSSLLYVRTDVCVIICTEIHKHWNKAAIYNCCLRLLLSIQLVNNEELITSYNFTVKETLKIGGVKTCVDKLMYTETHITLFQVSWNWKASAILLETFLLMKKYPEVDSVLVFLNVLVFVSIIYAIIHFW